MLFLADVSSNRFAESQVGVGQADFSGYSAFPGANSFGYYAPQSNIRLPNSGRLMPATSINSFGQLNQQSSDPESSWLPLNNLYTFAQPTASKKRVTAGDLSSSVSNSQGIQRDQTYDYGTNLAPINSNNYRNVRPYAEPTGPPFGIQSTGDILSYTPEKLDLSKCGPCKNFSMKIKNDSHFLNIFFSSANSKSMYNIWFTISCITWFSKLLHSLCIRTSTSEAMSS